MANKAVIPAAGLGTRFYPATRSQPKEMLPIIDMPVIHFVIEEALTAGYDDILIVTNKDKRALEDYVDTMGFDVTYVRQNEQKGLGHAILRAEKHVGDNPFAILLGDTILLNQCLKDMTPNMIAVEHISDNDTEKYGVVKAEPMSGKILDLVEKPKPDEAPSRLGIIGRYVLKPSIFQYLKQTKPGHNGEIQLTDALRLMANTENLYVKEYGGKRYDIGDKFDYIRATIDFAMKRKEFSAKTKEHICGLL